MDSQTYIDALVANGERVFEAAAVDLTAPVGACPGWDVAKLVGHLGQVYGYIALLADVEGTERPDVRGPRAPGPDQVIEWARGQHGEVVETLHRVDPQANAWNWAGTGSAGFFHRRMAHETLIHRCDVEAAVGSFTSIDSDLGADCVDELIDVGLRASSNPAREYSYPAGSLHLHRTDGDGEWLLRAEQGSLVATREHAKGDVAVRGTGGDLALYMWGRYTPGTGGDDLEIFGDRDLAEEWSRVAP